MTHLADARVLHRQVATLVALSSANVGGAAPRQRGDLPAQYSSIHQMSQERLFSIKKEKIRKQILRLSPRNMWRTLGTPDVSTKKKKTYTKSNETLKRDRRKNQERPLKKRHPMYKKDTQWPLGVFFLKVSLYFCVGLFLRSHLILCRSFFKVSHNFFASVSFEGPS